MTRQARTAAISATTIVVLAAVGIAMAVQHNRLESEQPSEVNVIQTGAPVEAPEQLEAKKREDESRQWADELHKVLVSTPEYQKEFEVGDSSLDDTTRSVDTALEEIGRRTR